MRLVGPNCFGVAVPGIGLDATFAAEHAVAGHAGVAVQSGGVGIALLEQLSRLGVGISSFASVGDKLDVSSNDMLTWWEQDGVTRIAVLYLESFGNPRQFGRTASWVGKKIPVVTVHAGRSAPGQRAAASHTAAIAAPLITREALFEQAGVIATAAFSEMLDVIAQLSAQPPPAGRRVAIFSNAGGAGVLAADACIEAGLSVHAVTDQAQRRLREILPPGAAVAGPVDTGAGVSAEAFRRGLETLAEDKGVDAVLALVVPTAVADLVTAVRTALPVTSAAVLLGQPEAIRLLPGAADGDPAGARLRLPGERRARARTGRQVRGMARHPGRDGAGPRPHPHRRRARPDQLLPRSAAGWWLAAAAVASELLRCYGLPLVDTQPASDAAAAARAAAELGCPVVMKADVPGLLHKTDAGAVRLDLRSPADARRAYRRARREVR